MKIHFKAFLFLVLLFICTTSISARETIRIGVLAYQPQHVLDQSWELLRKTLNRRFPDYDIQFFYLDLQGVERRVSNRSLEFIFTTPGHYIYLNKRYGLSSPLARLIKQENSFPLSAYGGVIFTRKNNPDINSIKDIANKKIATIGTRGLGGYMLQVYEMLKNGMQLPEQKDLLITGQPHDRVVDAVLNNEAEVGFVRTNILERLVANAGLDIDTINIINQQALPGYPYVSSTPLYPEWPFAAMPHINSKLTRKITGYLLSLDHGQTTIEQTGFYGFDIPASYESVDQVLRTLKAPPYDFDVEIQFVDIWDEYNYLIVLLGLFILILVAIITTVTLFNRKLSHAHQTISKQTQMLNDVIASSHVIVWIWDVERNQVRLNQHWSEITGYVLKLDGEVSSDDFFNLMHPVDMKDTRVKLDQLFRNEINFFESEIRLKDKSGNWIWVLTRGRVVDWNGANPAIVSGTLLDITKNKEYEIRLENEVSERTEELKRAKETAEQANLEKTRFLANMSHELRTPMHAILSFSSLGLKKAEDTKTRGYLDKIHTSGERLLKLLNDLLDLSKLELGRLSLEYESAELSVLVRDSLSELDSLISHKELEVEFVCEQQIHCDVDSKLLQQVIINLLSNAIKFSYNEGKIIIKAMQLNESLVQFSVTDEGVGIPENELEDVFDKFVQSSKTRSGGGGTGLGLSISREIIRLHHGRIWAQSPPNGLAKGSIFIFEIPVSQ